MVATVSQTGGSEWSPTLVEMYRAHYSSLVRTAKRSVQCPDLAEEVVHDAFVTYHAKSCRPKPGRELAYLRTMVVNRGHTVTRRAIRAEVLTVPDWFSDPTPEDTCMARLDAENVREAITGLSGRQQQVLTLRYVHGFNEAEIAEALDISAGSVKTHATRGREALRHRLLPMM